MHNSYSRCRLFCVLLSVMLLTGCSFAFPVFVRNISSQPVIVRFDKLEHGQLEAKVLRYSPRLYTPTYKTMRLLTDTLQVKQQEQQVAFELPPHATCLLSVTGFTVGSPAFRLELQRADSSVQKLGSADIAGIAHYKTLGGKRMWLDIQ
jgi:uncharacterized protein YcfL